METSKICRLCLKICKTNFLPVNEITKEVLDVLLVKMDLDISENPVKCKECLKNLQKCFEFKSVCIVTEEGVVAVLESRNICKTNMMQVYLQDEKNKSTLPKIEEVCRLCTKPVTQYFTSDELDEDINFSNMMKKYLPEVKLFVTSNPVTCSNCLNSLKNYFTFLKNCQDVEEYIKEYCKSQNIEEKVELNNVVQYMLQHIMSECIGERAPSRLKKDDCDQVTITEEQSVESCSSNSAVMEKNVTKGHLVKNTDPADAKIIINEVDLIEIKPADIIDMETVTKEEHVTKEYLVKNTDPAEAKIILNEEDLIEIKPADIVDIDTVIKEEQMTETFPSDIADAKAITDEKPFVETYFSDTGDTKDYSMEKNTKNLTLVIKNESCDNDVFPEGCSDENNTKDIDMEELKIEDIDIKHNNIELERSVLMKSTEKKENISDVDRCQEVFVMETNTNRDESVLVRGESDSSVSCMKQKNYTTNNSHNDENKTNMVLKELVVRLKREHFNSCLHCGNFMKRKSSYEICVKPYNKRTVYKCLICNCEMETINDMKKHLPNHKDPAILKTYQCIDCILEMETKQARNENLKLFVCHECEHKTKKKTDFKRHLLVHKEKEDLNMLKCSQCTFETKYKKNLKTHYLLKHNPNEKTDTEVFICAHCGYITKYKQQLKIHLTVHVPDIVKIYRCEFCNYRTNIKEKMEHHKKSLEATKDHNLPTKNYKIEPNFQCTQCNFVTKYTCALKWHLMDHTRDKTKNVERTSKKICNQERKTKFKCAYCTYETNRMYNMKLHQVTHLKDEDEIKRYKCEDCKFQTTHRMYLVKHRRICRKKYKCEKCVYTTSIKKRVKIHEQMHKKVHKKQIFTCEQCGFLTEGKLAFKRHLGVHIPDTAEKLYKCAHCVYQTNVKFNMIQHQQKVNAKKHHKFHMEKREQIKISLQG